MTPPPSPAAQGSPQATNPTLLIAGAGLAGLSCAAQLSAAHLDYRLIESAPVVGGAARSFRRGDFWFDITGHWLHLRHDAIRRWVFSLLPEDQWHVVQRRARIYSHGVYTPYPFQANTHGLPTAVVAECVLGFFAAREAAARGELPPPRTFEDYIRQRMGDGIAQHFMIPYNTKLWTVPPADMAHDWCGRFVPVPTPQEVVRGALEPAGAGHNLGYNSSFYYPKGGGIGVLAEAIDRSLSRPAEVGCALERVDWQRQRAHLSTGEQPYRALVSTLPLVELVARLQEPPAHVREACAQLRSTAVTYWDLGFARPNGEHDAHWIYFPEPHVPFYRVGSPSAAVPGLAPPGHRSYYVEVAHPSGTPCSTTTEQVLDSMRQVGLVGPDEEPVLAHRSTVPCAYVIMDHAYGEATQVVQEFLREHNIWSVGRYGAWTYDSMEGALVQGRDAALQVSQSVS